MLADSELLKNVRFFEKDWWTLDSNWSPSGHKLMMLTTRQPRHMTLNADYHATSNLTMITTNAWSWFRSRFHSVVTSLPMPTSVRGSASEKPFNSTASPKKSSKRPSLEFSTSHPMQPSRSFGLCVVRYTRILTLPWIGKYFGSWERHPIGVSTGPPLQSKLKKLFIQVVNCHQAFLAALPLPCYKKSPFDLNPFSQKSS